MSTILRNAVVVDGTGDASQRADVLIEDGKIAEIGLALPVAPVEEVDLTGLVLAPGFIDPHTHYDAQITWDPDLTPSSWHGITTVILGNCGFGIAPTHPADRDLMARTLENVEGMSYDALAAGVDWAFETYPDYLDYLEAASKRLNVASYIGHTPVRRYVLRSDAAQREASDDELAQMKALVAEGLEAGAIGFSTSREPGHWGAYGEPVPSRLASIAEVESLGLVLSEAQRGIFAIAPGGGLEADAMLDLTGKLDRPVTYTGLVTRRGSGDKREHERPGAAVEFLNTAFPPGCSVYPQIACRPIVHQLMISEPLSFYKLQSFSDMLEASRDQRAALYADDGWRQKVINEMNSKGWFESTWKHFSVAESEHSADLTGIPLTELARQSGRHPFEVLVEIALKDGLDTRFHVVASNDDEDELALLLTDDRTLLGLSDAGAHTSQICDACYSTFLLSHWVRERKALTLEKAIWRLTGHPATVFGIDGRGYIRPGYAADLVAFDADTVGHQPLERVWDLPAGRDRLIARSIGVEHVWVNGVRIRAGGQDCRTPEARSAGTLIRARR